jgi:hypothetical protein
MMRIWYGVRVPLKKDIRPTIRKSAHNKDEEWCGAYYQHMHLGKLILWLNPKWWFYGL